ncbi:MAG: hemerythrin family protein [Alphaproteobacteria bacterium]|nr:hemerythrin family protein [Alphaproteobacteria bacterium]
MTVCRPPGGEADPVSPFDQAAAGDARSLFEWTQAVATGHPEIDEDDKRLLLLLQELQAAHQENQPQIVGDALRRLEEYTRVHFSREEKMMLTFDYTDIARHKLDHAAVITKLSVIKGNIGDHLTDLERIVIFLFDWLVKHINTVDRAMVDRMRRGEVTFLAGAVNAQTNLVIDAAYALAISIERMSTRLGHIVDPGQRERLRREIGDASDRLCNMVALANGRVDELGGSPSQLQRLSGLRTAMINASSRLIEGSAHRLSRYAKSILDGRRGLPYGIGDALHQRLNSIVTLVEMAGGFDSVNESAHEAIREAVDAVNGCLEMESHQANLPTYDESPPPAVRVALVVPPRKPAPPKAAPPVLTPTPAPTPPPSADSQQDVLTAAKRRPG